MGRRQFGAATRHARHGGVGTYAWPDAPAEHVSVVEPGSARLDEAQSRAPKAGTGSPRVVELPALTIGGCRVHLASKTAALQVIDVAARNHVGPPVAVSSVNLDHIHHFGDPGRGRDAVGEDAGHPVQWLNLVDGAPIAREASRRTRRDIPRLAGSDLIDDILATAAANGQRVGVLGGTDETRDLLAARVGARWPLLDLAGHWTPSRSQLVDPAAAANLAHEIADAEVSILLVCLGKPRQEQWIEAYGALTGAGVLLAFGAVVDFLAGRVSRAPAWVSQSGLEWLWRLALEPRRLARRYLVQGPRAYLAVRGVIGA